MWLIPLLPVMSGIILLVLKKIVHYRFAGILATVSVLVSAFLSYIAAFLYFGQNVYYPLIINNYDWIKYAHNIKIDIGILIDPLSMLLVLVVCTVSLCVHCYSNSYIPDSASKIRFFMYLNFFTASMLGLIMSINIVQVFFFWELIGTWSFLLIGFYYHKNTARSAAKKSFIITRFADLGFLVGIILLIFFNFTYYNEINSLLTLSKSFTSANNNILNFLFITHPITVDFFKQEFITVYGVNIVTLASYLIFIGACGKSAMFPFHVWLPDAMEGPTPVSALIHAATLVIAGIFLIARLINVFTISSTLMSVVTYLGVMTSLMGALIACCQYDIKKILAFSTISQLGYMMLAIGTARMSDFSGYSASIFHLFTHAFFKALLFLSAGAIINITGTNSIWKMNSNLLRSNKLLLAIFLIATCSISGIPPLAGFHSKDYIFLVVKHSQQNIVLVLSIITAFLTSFYMFRLFFIIYFSPSIPDSSIKSKEVGKSMYFPMIFLAILSVFAGFINVEKCLFYSFPPTHISHDFSLVATSIFVSISGLVTAYLICFKFVSLEKYNIFNIYYVFENKLFIDKAYLFIVHKIIFGIIAKLVSSFDKKIVDKTINIVGTTTISASKFLIFIHVNQLQTYAFFFIVGFLSFFIVLV